MGKGESGGFFSKREYRISSASQSGWRKVGPVSCSSLELLKNLVRTWDLLWLLKWDKTQNHFSSEMCSIQTLNKHIKAKYSAYPPFLILTKWENKKDTEVSGAASPLDVKQHFQRCLWDLGHSRTAGRCPSHPVGIARADFSEWDIRRSN